METKYYVVGLRPVIWEKRKDYDTFLAFQWETGEFKQDMQYNEAIYFDASGDVEEYSKKEFDQYVKKLKKERGLPE